MASASVWGALVVLYLGPGSEHVRTVVAGSFAALGLAALVGLGFRRARRPAFAGLAALFVLALVVWARATPSNVLAAAGCDFVIGVNVTSRIRPEFAGNRPEMPTERMQEC